VRLSRIGIAIPHTNFLPQSYNQDMSVTPREITLRTKSHLLLVSFDDDSTFEYSFEYLRTHSPSAEVKGHGPGQEVLQTGKENVILKSIEPVGHYAVRLIFDDGHDTGLYTWQYLYELGQQMDANWRTYLDRLAAAEYARQKPE
jgi:DUF971 family protein